MFPAVNIFTHLVFQSMTNQVQRKVFGRNIKWGHEEDRIRSLQKITYDNHFYEGCATKEPQDEGHVGVGGGKSGIVIQNMASLEEVAAFLRLYGAWPYCKVTSQRTMWFHHANSSHGHHLYETIYERDLPPDIWEQRKPLSDE